MEKPIYPSKYMRITQGYDEIGHKETYAIDEAGLDQEISTMYAPFTGIIKKIYKEDANEVWLESLEEVEYPDGTIDYMTIMFAHSNDVSNLFVGKIIRQNEAFYTEGTKGKATGNHCHIECGKGKFTGTGWYKNNSGSYSINNGKRPEECLWIDDTITIINNANYNFKKISPKEDNTTLEQKPEDTTEELQENNEEKPIFICRKNGLYGIYLNENEKVYIKT